MGHRQANLGTPVPRMPTRISLDVDSLKQRSIPPKHDINESLKSMRISVDECKERTAKMRAKRDWFVKGVLLVFVKIMMKILK